LCADPAEARWHTVTDLSLSGLSDAQLLERHVEGDPDAFGLLFLRHRDRLWAVALRTLCDPEEAADALQEAMISAFRRAGDFRGDSAVTTWLHRIVVNASLDRLRRKAAHAASSVGDEGTLDLLATQGRVPATTDPASHRDTTLDVEAALRLIPPEQRAALVLVDMLGYPVADAAAVLDISVGTVKSRCARGRARLLPYLEHLRGGPTADPAAEDGISRNRTATGSVSPGQGGDG
jgi:RNA polymerase sigma-70 factor (ECF subfamily)